MGHIRLECKDRDRTDIRTQIIQKYGDMTITLRLERKVDKVQEDKANNWAETAIRDPDPERLE